MISNVLENFKARALRADKDGLYDSIDLTFQLLLGKGSHFHNGKSVFEYQPSYCNDDIYSYFIGRLSEAMTMYKVALKMNSQEIFVNTLKDWTKNFALVQEAYGRHCGCPKDFQFEQTKPISKIFQRLPAPQQNLQKNYRSTVLLSRNLLTRQKITLLLDLKNFDINDQSLNVIEDYTIEDILLVVELVKAGQFDNLANLAKIYEGIGKCVTVPYHLEAEKTIEYGGEVQVSKGLKRPDVIYNWGYQYIIRFDLEINQNFAPSWLNVFRITSTDNNNGNHGDRVPALFVNKDRSLSFTNSVGSEWNHHFRFEYELNKQYHIEMIQTEISGSQTVRFCIQIDGEMVHCMRNDNPRTFQAVRLYTSDRFHDALTPYGKLSSLTITKFVSTLMRGSCDLNRRRILKCSLTFLCFAVLKRRTNCSAIFVMKSPNLF